MPFTRHVRLCVRSGMLVVKIRLFIAGASVGMLAAACSGESSSPPDPASATTTEPTASASPAESPHVTTGGTSQGVFLLQHFPDGGALTAIDPLTGEDIPGLGPIDAFQALNLAVSADGGLALGMRSPGPDPVGALMRIDLHAWEVEEIGPFGMAWWGGAWSPDGAKQYAITGNSAEARRLFVVDAGARTVTDIAPIGVNTLGALVSPDGARFYTIGFRVAIPGSIVIEGEPFLLAIDLTNGQASRLQLPGLLVGERLEESPVRSYVQYTPGVALSPDGSILYIAHAESDRISVIDTASLTVASERAVTRRRSRWDRLRSGVGRWLVSSVEAKGGGVVERTLTFTPDGKYLLLTGHRNEWCDDRLCQEHRPEGLKVLDPGSLRILREVPDVSRVAISADGARIAAYAPYWFTEPIVDSAYTWRATGVTVIDGDAVEGRVRKLHNDQAITDVLFAPDGDRLLTLSPAPGLADANNNRGHCAKPCYVLRVTSISTQRIVATRFLDSFNPTLFGPGNDSR